MKSHGQQRQLATARVGEINRRFKHFNGPLTPIGRRPRTKRLVQTLFQNAIVEERNRLAGEIHDTLAQGFAGILLHLEAAHRSGKTARQNVDECLVRARELAKSGLEDARRMLLGLRPKSLEGVGLPEALRQLADRFSRECGIRCAFSMTGRMHKFPQHVGDELYRVVQEALCNARKHSRACSVSILLNSRPGGVVLAIKDDGKGFAMTEHRAGTNGFGLPTMCDRAHRLGGKIDINTAPGTGTELKMTVPLPGKTSTERTYL